MKSSLAVFITVLLAWAPLPGCGDEPASDGNGGAGTRPPAAAPAGSAGAPSGDHGLDDGLRAEIAAALAKGRTFLLGQQSEQGGFGDDENQIPANVSYTAMAVTGLVAATPQTAVAKDASVRRALEFLKAAQQENGAIVDDPRITNYCTSVSVSALAAARIGEFAKVQARASAYLQESQIQDEASDSYGGFPYKQDKGQPADASNAGIATDALGDDGLPADSPVRERIGRFASRLQNHSETNTGSRVVVMDGEEREVVAGVDGGGFYHVGESKAGMVKRSDGKWELRSYGSMTYAVLKLLLFAGIDPQDPRVKAVVRWMSNNWTVARNPGFEAADDSLAAGQQGIFYYLYTATRALTAYEQATKSPLVVADADGRRHNWRREIARELLSRQKEDGSWRNDVANRWEEGSKTLATAFALQTLAWLDGRFR